MGFLYLVFIHLLALAIKAASLFNPKAKAFVAGRKKLWQEIETLQSVKQEKVWVHCASLGEFEQARPLIEELKKQNPAPYILLTFFSPSGFEVQKNYQLADLVTYMPIDTKQNAKRFLELGNFDAIFFVKYEFWFNFLIAIKNKQIPTYLISGIFWKAQQFFQFYGQWFAAKLTAFTHFFVQNKESRDLLNAIGYENVTISGDSRFDRVFKLAQESFQSKTIEDFKDDKKCLIFGSAWEKEMSFAKSLLKENTGVKIILAPHEVEEEKILKIQTHFKSSIRYTQAKEGDKLSNYQVLIIDSIGMLSKLYRFGDIAIIGGGFGKGIHNTLEAAVYGIPVVFGPNYQRFQEAKDLLKCGGGYCVQNTSEFKAQIDKLLSNPEQLKKASAQAKKYVQERTGATKLILDQVEKEQFQS
ncbi:MAG: glycosyltransferase N-terminal domain-containing protein [Vicingaceae bacterium]